MYSPYDFSMSFWQGNLFYPLIAQLVEQLPFKERVAGSIPAERTRKNDYPKE